MIYENNDTIIELEQQDQEQENDDEEEQNNHDKVQDKLMLKSNQIWNLLSHLAKLPLKHPPTKYVCQICWKKRDKLCL